MSKANVNNNQTLESAQRSELTRKLESIGWGLFFLWMGIALFGHIGWGVGLLGVGIITLGAQAARKYFGLKLEGFWVAVGFLFVVGGSCRLVNVQLGLLPILCIVAGVALLVSTLIRGREINRAGKRAMSGSRQKASASKVPRCTVFGDGILRRLGSHPEPVEG